MAKTLSVTKARQELTSLVDGAKKLLQEYVITVNGSPAAVLMSHEEFESWKETVEILSDPGLLKAIKKGEKELKEGKYVSYEDLRKQLDV